jgi:capsid protein
MMQHLRPGEEITFNSPPTPGNYSEYVTKNQQKAAAGFGITYESFAGDYSNTNFSSGRMGWMEMSRQVEDWQYNMFIPQFCDNVWDWFIEGLNIRGIISKKCAAEWTPQGREMIDPVKEMNGLILELKSGLVSWTEACKRRGYNPETLLEQIKSDRERFEKLGINVEWIIENEPTVESTEGGDVPIDSEENKRTIDSYGIAVRAGAITPIKDDEKHFRNLIKLPEMNEAVEQAWKDAGGFRTPITLKVEEEKVVEGEEKAPATE